MNKLVAVFALSLSGCGASGDLTIESLTLSPSTIAVSTQATVIAAFDTEAVYSQVHFRLLEPNRHLLTEDTFAKDGPNFREPNGVTLPMSIPTAARYTFELWVSEGGAESNHLEAFLTAQ